MLDKAGFFMGKSLNSREVFNMFAIICLGNQQFKVKAGDFIRVPFQSQPLDSKIDVPIVAFSNEKDLVFDKTKLKKSKVKAVVVRQLLSRKVLVFKKKRRKGYRRTRGHRQKMTELKIMELHSPEGKVNQVKWTRPSKTSSSGKKVQSQERTKPISDKKSVQKQSVSKTKKPAKKRVAKKAIKAGGKSTLRSKKVNRKASTKSKKTKKSTKK